LPCTTTAISSVVKSIASPAIVSVSLPSRRSDPIAALSSASSACFAAPSFGPSAGRAGGSSAGP